MADLGPIAVAQKEALRRSLSCCSLVNSDVGAFVEKGQCPQVFSESALKEPPTENDPIISA